MTKLSPDFVAPNIFEYQDFRQYLLAFYTNRKVARESFSYEILARKIGITKSHLIQIVRGKRNLTQSMIDRFCEGLEIKGRQRTYFMALVMFQQSTSEGFRKILFDIMNRAKPGSTSVPDQTVVEVI